MSAAQGGELSVQGERRSLGRAQHSVRGRRIFRPAHAAAAAPVLFLRGATAFRHVRPSSLGARAGACLVSQGPSLHHGLLWLQSGDFSNRAGFEATHTLTGNAMTTADYTD